MTEHGDDPAEGPIRARAVELARRLNLLQDVTAAENGAPFTYNEIRDALGHRGFGLSSGRWFYMLAGNGPLTSDAGLLAALAEIYEVEPAYLLEWDDAGLPERVLAQRELVRSLRRNKITNFAARSMGPLTPDALRAISELIDSQIERDFGGSNSN